MPDLKNTPPDTNTLRSCEWILKVDREIRETIAKWAAEEMFQKLARDRRNRPSAPSSPDVDPPPPLAPLSPRRVPDIPAKRKVKV